MDYGGPLETRVRNTVCRMSPIPNKGLEISVTLIVKRGSTNSKVFRKMKHFMEEYYIETDLTKKPEVDENDELSNEEISDEFVPVEEGEETNAVEVSVPNDDNGTNIVVKADERNDDDRINATVVDERNNCNGKEQEQSDNSVIIMDD